MSPDPIGCTFHPFMLMTTPTTVETAATGAEHLLRAISDDTRTTTTTATRAPGAIVVLLQVPPLPQPDDLMVLSEAEHARAGRFAFARDQAAFVTTRAALRRALADTLGCAPHDVALVSRSNGRPALDDTHASALDFNVSHSGGMAAIALSHSGRVGVDIEAHDARRGLRELVPTVMGRRERHLLDCQPDDAAFADVFYACWTRKEAIVKGIGTGISTDLTAIDIPEIPSDGMVPVASDAFPRWQLVTTRVRPGVTLSVALSGSDDPIHIAPAADRA